MLTEKDKDLLSRVYHLQLKTGKPHLITVNGKWSYIANPKRNCALNDAAGAWVRAKRRHQMLKAPRVLSGRVVAALGLQRPLPPKAGPAG